jgi:hypothetical protein
MNWQAILETVFNFLKENNYSLQNPLVIMGLVGLGFGIFRGWNLSNLFWFFVCVFILVFLNARLDVFFASHAIGVDEESRFFAYAAHGGFALAIVIVFFYFQTIKD